MRTLSETELTDAAGHLTACPDCHAEFVSTLRRQRDVADLSFTLAPEFWLRHEHLDYEKLVDLADNKLDATDREFIDLHLKTCPPCQEDVRSFLAFREQITPELLISYAPTKEEPAPAGLSWMSWWRGLTWKPAYSAAFILIGIALVIGAVLLLNRSGENQQAQYSPTPQVSPDSTPGDRAANLSSPNESPSEKLINAEAVVVLNDRGGTIQVDRTGNVSGLDDVPESTRDAIAKALLTERIEPPAILRELGGPEASLRSPKTEQPFKLLSPSRTVIVSTQPTLRWEKASSATSYRVYVNYQAGNEIAKSPELQSDDASWVLPKPLTRGMIYTWTVVAIVEGKEIVSPGPASPEMKFQVLALRDFEQLKELKKTRSHLALGLFYSKVGMMAESEREFEQLSRLNPGSKKARELLSRIRSIRAAER